MKRSERRKLGGMEGGVRPGLPQSLLLERPQWVSGGLGTPGTF